MQLLLRQRVQQLGHEVAHLAGVLLLHCAKYLVLLALQAQLAEHDLHVLLTLQVDAVLRLTGLADNLELVSNPL